MRSTSHIVIVALGYFLAGKVALLLAIPPGYATAVWPAAGLALTAVLLVGPHAGLGVLLGSFAVNVSVAASLHTSDVLIAFGIGAGAAAQAVVGARLVRRFVPHLALERPADIARFLALGGPVSCALNASVGPVILLAAGRITTSEFAFNWWTWWVGDAIGVMTTSPLLLVAFAEPRALWRARALTVALPLVVALGLAVIAFVTTSGVEQRRVQHRFGERATTVAEAVRRHLLVSADVVRDMAALRQVNPTLDAATFAQFAALQRGPESGIQALSWNPRIRADEREAFEAEGSQLRPPVRIHAGPEGVLDPAGDHFPSLWIDPLEGNEAALGFDLRSESVRRRALERARETRAHVVTDSVRLVQERSDQAGFLIMVPVFEESAQAPSAGALVGMAVGVFRTWDFLRAATRGVSHDGLVVTLVEDSRDVALLPERSSEGADAGLLTEFSMAQHGAPWTLRVTATPAYAAAARSWVGWGVLAAGLMFAALLGGGLLVLTGRASSIERLVAERTSALSEAHRVSRQERAKFERLLEAAPDPVLIIDEAGTLVLVNRQAEVAFEYSRDEMVGQKVEMLLPEGVRAAHARHRVGYFQKPALRPMGAGLQLAGRRKDGTEFPVDISLSPIETAEGVLVTAALRDVTEQRNAQRTLELLREIAILSNSASSVDGVLASCLERLCEYTRLPVGHAYALDIDTGNLRPTGVWRVGAGLDVEAFRQVTMKATFTRGQGLPGQVLEKREAQWFEDVRGDPRFIRGGRVQTSLRGAFAFPVLVGREVTHVLELFSPEAVRPAPDLLKVVEQIGTQVGRVVERVRAQEQRIYAEALERSNQELQLFAHVASHDLREPLRMVTSFMGLLKDRYAGQLDERANRYIGHAVDGAERMDALIHSLLVYSRLDTQGQPPTACDAGAALAQAIANLRDGVVETGARITHDPLPTVAADDAQLVQLFQNLISNALKFRRQRPEIRVGAVRSGDVWQLSVSDDGIGIDMTYSQRIFKIFQRLHTREEYPGTGIGLSICKRIVQRHGGKIWVESLPGRGSTFHFTLKAWRDQEANGDGIGETAGAAG